MTEILERFGWLDAAEHRCPLGGIFTVSFFRGVGPGEVLHRFGAPAAGRRRMSFGELCGRVGGFLSGGAGAEGRVHPPAGGTGGGYVGVRQSGEWSVALELSGWEATLPDVTERLSQGCEVVAATRHDYAEHSFMYAVDGDVVTCFDPQVPGHRHGSRPDALNSPMRRAGCDPQCQEMCFDDPMAMAFALTAGITGVEFTPEVLEQPLLVGDVRHLGEIWGATA